MKKKRQMYRDVSVRLIGGEEDGLTWGKLDIIEEEEREEADVTGIDSRHLQDLGRRKRGKEEEEEEEENEKEMKQERANPKQ